MVYIACNYYGLLTTSETCEAFYVAGPVNLFKIILSSSFKKPLSVIHRATNTRKE